MISSKSVARCNTGSLRPVLLPLVLASRFPWKTCFVQQDLWYQILIECASPCAMHVFSRVFSLSLFDLSTHSVRELQRLLSSQYGAAHHHLSDRRNIARYPVDLYGTSRMALKSQMLMDLIRPFQCFFFSVHVSWQCDSQ